MGKPRCRAHYGYGQPVPDGVRVEVLFRDGEIGKSINAEYWSGKNIEENNWIKMGDGSDIVAYRLSQ